MADFEGDPPLLQRRPGGQKAVKLGHSIGLAPVGVRKVGKQALGLQTGQAAQPGDLVRRLLLPARLPQKAQPAHAGVQHHMDPQGPPSPLGGGGQPSAGLQILHHLGHIQLQQQGD